MFHVIPSSCMISKCRIPEMRRKSSRRVFIAQSRFGAARAFWETFPASCRRGPSSVTSSPGQCQKFCLAFLAQSWSLAPAPSAVRWASPHPRGCCPSGRRHSATGSGRVNLSDLRGWSSLGHKAFGCLAKTETVLSNFSCFTCFHVNVCLLGHDWYGIWSHFNEDARGNL